LVENDGCLPSPNVFHHGGKLAASSWTGAHFARKWLCSAGNAVHFQWCRDQLTHKQWKNPIKKPGALMVTPTEQQE